jgi:hypothetical protein
LYCPKCDTIIFVSLQFDEYVDDAQIRFDFLDSIERAGVCNVPTLRAESAKRARPLMQSLANRIDNLTRVFPPDIASEVFRRALTKSKAKAESMARNTKQGADERNEAYRAIARATAAVTENRDALATASESAYDGFDHAGNEEATQFFD